MADKVRAAGGEIYAVSSEPQALSDRARESWGLDFETVGDPHQEISGGISRRGWLSLIVNPELEFLQRSAGKARDWEPTHPKGYFQPGVLALTSDGRVLYRWRSIPTHQNVGGAMERPTAEHVWQRVEAALASDADVGDAPLDADPALDGRGFPWILFVPLLISNGRFLDGRGFGNPKDIPKAALRLLVFIAAWIAAFILLPTLPVAIALGAWAAYITPRVRWLGRQFQDASGLVQAEPAGSSGTS